LPSERISGFLPRRYKSVTKGQLTNQKNGTICASLRDGSDRTLLSKTSTLDEASVTLLRESSLFDMAGLQEANLSKQPV
jgi:hypothetical protein